MEGYYDHHPTHGLSRHLVVAGYLGDLNRTMAFRLGSMTGLPVQSLDRLIEHHAGKSVWDLIWSEGEERYRRLESEILSQTLGQRPFGILGLGDGALIDEANQRRVAETSDLVVLDLDLANFYWRLKASERADLDFWHPLHAGPLERFEQVKPYYQRRQPGFAAARHRITLPGRDTARILDELIELIDELSPAP